MMHNPQAASSTSSINRTMRNPLMIDDWVLNKLVNRDDKDSDEH